MTNTKNKNRTNSFLDLLTHDEVFSRLKNRVATHKIACKFGRYCEICSFLDNAAVCARLFKSRQEYSARILVNDERRSGILCIYCGGGADVRLPLIPYEELNQLLVEFIPNAPCCLSCESLLVDAQNFDTENRASHIVSELKKVNQAELAHFQHSQSELDELEGTLAVSVRARQFKRDQLRARIWVLERKGLHNIEIKSVQFLTNCDYSLLLQHA